MSKSFDELLIGERYEKKVTVSKLIVEKFIDLSGDTNPLHVDAAYAKAEGFLGCVVHGSLSACFLSELIGIHLPGKYGMLVKMDLNFKRPIYVNDELVYSVKVISKNFGKLVTLGIDVSRESETCVSGQAVTRMLR